MKRRTEMQAGVALLLLAGLGCSSTNGATSRDGGQPAGDSSVADGGGSKDGPGAADGPRGDAPADAPVVSATGISKVVTGEYETSYLIKGRLYGVAGTLPRLGAGPHPPSTLFPPAEVAFAPDLTVADAAGGLHVTIATDNNGHVWEWGDAASNPALAMSDVPVQITPDSKGNDFTLLDSAGNNARSMAASVQTSVAVKGDGTVWVWDNCTGGMQGDGTAGSATVTNPIEVPIPLASRASITKVVISDIIVALASDGTVWSWGGDGVTDLGTGNADYMHPHQVANTSTGAALPKIVDIATGQQYSYALTADGDLYAWGVYMEIVGMCSGWCPAPLPTLVTDIVTGNGGGTGAHIASICANTEASYALMSDGTLWAWGSNGEGLVGNGVEPDYATTTPPDAWDWGKDDLLVNQAVHIAPEVNNFVAVFTGAADVFYVYAMTADGKLYSWGRNKTGDLGNGISPLNSQQAATYPNSWDVTTPTQVSPMTAPNKPTSTPYCLENPDAGSCWCAGGESGPQTC
jgi:alpha-tubulin suppressor-like RCC1 family protein